MRIHLTRKNGARRFAGVAVAVTAAAFTLGLIPAASASTAAPAGRRGPGFCRGRARPEHLPLATDAGRALGHRPSE